MTAVFAFFGLWETTLLAGAGAVSIPVIVHLLNRRRYRIITWAAMRFLLAAQKQNTRRLRVEQLLLLAVRCLLVLLIVLAMASVMPWAENVWGYFWPDAAGIVKTRATRTHNIIVLDGSLSMNLVQDGGTSFDKARRLAIEKVRGASAGDGFSVLLMKDNPTWIVGEISQDGRKVAGEIETLTPAHGNSSVPATLGMIASKLTEGSGRFHQQAVYFLTDVQQATWSQVPAPESAPVGEGQPKNLLSEIGEAASVIFVDVGKDDVSNVAVSDVSIDVPFVTTGMLVGISATVQNFGQQPRKNVRVELLTGRAREAANDEKLSLRAVGQVLKDIAPAERQTVTFPYRFTTPGTYAVQVHVDSDDLDVDDSRTVIVTVKETVPILLVNGKQAPDRFDRATEYLRLALNPFPRGTEPKYAPLRPTVVSAAQFAEMTEEELADFDAMYMCDVGKVGFGELRRLELFLRLGGGVVFGMGSEVADNLEMYNRVLYKDGDGIFPVKLESQVVAPPEHYFALEAAEAAYALPPLRNFSDDKDKIALRSSRFRQYLRARPADDPNVRTFLTYQPMLDPLANVKLDGSLTIGDPAMLEWNPPLPRDPAAGAAAPAAKARDRMQKGPLAPARHRGKVVLFTSTFNMDWNSWPGSPSFGAMMQEVTRLAVTGKLRENAAQVGDTLVEIFAQGGLEFDVSMSLPDPLDRSRLLAKKAEGKPQEFRTVSHGEVSIFRWSQTDISGIYVLTAKEEPKEYPFAVNFPASVPGQKDSESNLARLSLDKLRDYFAGIEIQLVTNPSQARIRLRPDAEIEMVQERTKVGPSVAHVMLLVALVLMIIEVILAWHFGHYTVIDGLNAPPATGRFWPITIATVAALVFAGLAYVLYDARQTGDFLGFLPSSFRGWAERALNVPPAPPGEGTRWELEARPLFFGGGNDDWWAFAIIIGVTTLLVFLLRSEAPTVRRSYKALLAGLRMFLILFMLFVLLPQVQLHFDRQGWPDVVLLFDDSRSMGEPDIFQDDAVRDRATELGKRVQDIVKETLPARVKTLEQDLAQKRTLLVNSPEDASLKAQVEALENRLNTWQNQLALANSQSWRPTRLQLAQALVSQPNLDWLQHLVYERRLKVHAYHLDREGRAIRLVDANGNVSEITDHTDEKQFEKTHKAIAAMQAEGQESRLGTALRQVIDHYRGASLASVIMFTDGVTTRDESIADAAQYAAQKGVPLFFVGIGDDHDTRDLRLHDLQVEDVVYVNDIINFECRLTGRGYKDISMPVVLKMKEENGKEIELERTTVKVDPRGRSVRVRLRHQAEKVGRKKFIIEAIVPKGEPGEKMPSPSNLRIERTIDIMDAKMIRILLVEGTPRYEFRFLKSLLERERIDENKNRSVELKVVLLDADPDFASLDKTALADFPATREELERYDVIILGDVDPRHEKLGDRRLEYLADFVRGEDRQGNKTGKAGGGLLFLAGGFHNPHSFRNTPLADVLPVEPDPKAPDEPAERVARYRVEMTPIGRMHPIFRFSPDEVENQKIWQQLPPLFWWSSGYRIKPLAEVLAVHPGVESQVAEPGQDKRHPLVVQQFVGSGRTMFFGFDESWRWRFREDEDRYNKFWIQTIRFLSRSRLTRTDLRLDRQTPYRVGEPVKVTVRFPDAIIPAGKKEPDRIAKNQDVKVIVEYKPNKEGAEPEIRTMTLDEMEGGRGNFEGIFTRTREGKYRFWLSSPDVSKQQPGGEKPSAEAIVELPPGELEKLRLNENELAEAADATQGRFYTIAHADRLLDDLPSGFRVSLSTPRPPIVLWNHVACFLLVMGLLTCEWVLRKRKHML